MKDEKYRLAPEVGIVARELIEDHHTHLSGARVEYLFRLGRWEKKHRQVLGQAKLAAEDIRFIADFDFIITVSLDAWNHADKHQRTALIDHELYHCTDNAGPDQDENVWGIDDHDVQEFIAVVRRYGLWQSELVEMMEAAKNPQNTSQIRLFGDETVEIYNDGKITGTISVVDGHATEAKTIDNETGEIVKKQKLS